MELLEKIILTQFIRINIGEEAYQAAQKHNIQGLIDLLQNTEKVWDRGISGNITEN